MKPRYSKIKNYIAAHKVVSAIVCVIVLGGGYVAVHAGGSSKQTRYIVGTASTSTIISTVSESGQVAASDQINVTAQVSGQLTWVGVKPGDLVRAGQALMTIDNTTAKQAYDDALKSYQADQLQYQKDSAQAPITYQNDQQSLATAQDDLATDYNTDYNDISSTYLDLPTIIAGMQDIIYGYDLDPTKSQWNADYLLNFFNTQSAQTIAQASGFESSAKTEYTNSNNEYTTSVNAYKETTRTSATSTTEATLAQTTQTLTDVAQALQTELNYLGAISDLGQTYNIKFPSGFTTLQNNARTYLNTANSDLSTLLNDKKALDTAKQTITTDEQNIVLAQVGNTDGSNPISLQIEKNNLDKEAEDLATQLKNLGYYTVTAPFAGTLATVPVQKGDNAGGTVATLITDQQIAQVSVNEVDAAKIQLGQKVTLTFDALPDLTLTGTVAEIDPVGTVSQGVVSYNVKISFDAQNNQIKPGMTVNADIETAVHQHVVSVPSTALKTQSGQSYVLVFNPPVSAADIASGGTSGVLPAEQPTQVPVTTGISDSTNTEITSGLVAGEQIIVRTVAASSASASSATKSAASAGATGGRAPFGGGGGAIRISG